MTVNSYNDYLGYHSLLHTRSGNRLWSKFQRLPDGLQMSDYQKQLKDFERELGNKQ